MSFPNPTPPQKQRACPDGYRYLRVDEYCLDGGVISLPAQRVMMEVRSGAAWISYDNHDVFLYPGDRLNIWQCQQAILVTPIRNGDQVVFRVSVHA